VYGSLYVVTDRTDRDTGRPSGTFVTEIRRHDAAGAAPTWSRRIPRQYWPIVPGLGRHHAAEKRELLLGQGKSTAWWLREFQVNVRVTPKLERGFREFCVRTADEQTRSERLLLLAMATVAFLSCGTVVALGVLLVNVVGRSAGLVGWLVTAVCLLVLKVLDITLARRRKPLLAAVCVGLVVLAAGPAFVADPAAAVQVHLLLGRLAGEPTGLALGVFLAASAALAIVALRGILFFAVDRAERLRHRMVVPDVKAFEQFHSIVRDMVDEQLVLAGPARVALAQRIVNAADRVEEMVHLYDRIDGLGHQKGELRRTLRSLARRLRQETKVLVSTIESDEKMLTCCLTCLAAISVGHAGQFPAEVADPRTATRAGRVELVKLRVFVAASMALAGVAADLAFHLDVGLGTMVIVNGLIALMAAVAPEPLIRKTTELRFWSWVTGWFRSSASLRTSDNDNAKGDQR